MSYPACNMPQRPCVLRRWLLRRRPPSEVLARRRGGRCLLTAKKRLYNPLRLKNLRVSAWEIGSCLRIFPISMKTRNFRGEGEGVRTGRIPDRTDREHSWHCAARRACKNQTSASTRAPRRFMSAVSATDPAAILKHPHRQEWLVQNRAQRSTNVTRGFVTPC